MYLIHSKLIHRIDSKMLIKFHLIKPQSGLKGDRANMIIPGLLQYEDTNRGQTANEPTYMHL